MTLIFQFQSGFAVQPLEICGGAGNDHLFQAGKQICFLGETDDQGRVDHAEDLVIPSQQRFSPRGSVRPDDIGAGNTALADRC